MKSFFKNNVFDILVLSLIAWFIYSCAADIINIWHVPGWLQILGFFINTISLIWLGMTYFGINNAKYKIFNVLLMLWFSPAWIYLDVVTFSDTIQVSIETFLVDTAMLFLLTLTNLCPKIILIESDIKNKLKELCANMYINPACNL